MFNISIRKKRVTFELGKGNDNEILCTHFFNSITCDMIKKSFSKLRKDPIEFQWFSNKLEMTKLWYENDLPQQWGQCNQGEEHSQHCPRELADRHSTGLRPPRDGGFSALVLAGNLNFRFGNNFLRKSKVINFIFYQIFPIINFKIKFK